MTDEKKTGGKGTGAADIRPDDPHGELRRKYKGRDLAVFEISDEAGNVREVIGLQPRKAEMSRYARDMGIRGADKAMQNLIVGIFPPGELKDAVNEILESNPFALIEINRAAMELIGAETDYEDAGERRVEDLDAGMEIGWRRVGKSDVNTFLRQVNRNPMKAMTGFCQAVVIEPESKDLKAYLDEQAGRAIALYGAISDREGIQTVASAKKI